MATFAYELRFVACVPLLLSTGLWGCSGADANGASGVGSSSATTGGISSTGSSNSASGTTTLAGTTTTGITAVSSETATSGSIGTGSTTSTASTSSGATTGATATDGTTGTGGATGDTSSTAGTTDTSGTTTTSTTGGVPENPNLWAISAGLVEVWVNGTLLGSTSSPETLLATEGVFVAGQQNIIAMRATKGSASNPYLQAELDGDFGKAGTSARWKVKAASSTDELTGDVWADSGYDDASWGLATDVAVQPTAAELVEGPAKGIWSSATADATVLFRLRLYIPANWSAYTATGFGKDTTGGEGGETVTVTTTAELVAAVADNTPRIIQISGRIDFRGTEGVVDESGCYVNQCATGESEYILGGLGACDGKTTFNIPVDQAGPNPLVIGANKTLIGLGPSAAILGKGLRFNGDTSENIIIRNLTISEINAQTVWGGDGINMFGSHNIWFDHNRISLIGRQFIVAAYDTNTNVTLSFNEFDGWTPYSATCNNATYWVNFLMGTGDTFTSHGNWYHHTSGRNPDIANTTMQFVNDYFETVPGHLAEMWDATNLLYEGTYFQDVDVVFGSPHSGNLFAPLGGTLSSVASACTTALGRNCVANVTNRSQNEANFTVEQPVLTTFSAYTNSLVTPFPASEVPNSIPHLAGPGHI